MPRRDVVTVACPRCKADGVEMDDHHAMLCGECMGEDDEWTDAEYDLLLEREESAKVDAAEYTMEDARMDRGDRLYHEMIDERIGREVYGE